MQKTLVVMGLVSTFSAAACKPKDSGTPDAGTVAVTPVPEATAAPVPDAAVEAPDAAPLAAPSAAATTSGKAVAPKIEGPFVPGETWSGTYSCGAPGRLALHITKVTGTKVEATFDFTTATNKSGSFKMSGTRDAQHLNLAAGNWINQPPGVVTVNLDGSVAPDNHQYAGRVIGPGCSVFHVRR